MEEFETLLAREYPVLERFVRFRLSNRADADDVLQETCLAACQKFPQLKNKAVFRAWLFSIARNKCTDHFRQRAAELALPVQALWQAEQTASRFGVITNTAVQETLARLGNTDKQMLYLYYWKELPLADIARALDLPLGTVKSRLHTARQHFKSRYPAGGEHRKGAIHMKQLPEILPAYTIEESALPPFPVRWEELMGWFLVPRLGEKLRWAMYDQPGRQKGETDCLEVVGKAEVHGIEGVEIHVHTEAPMPCNAEGGETEVTRTFVAQLTDTHCRYLAESHLHGGVRKLFTFLDGESFLGNWGFGEDNCGNEVNLSPKGDIHRCGSAVTTADKPFLLDVVGRYTVTVGEKTWDTVCVMDVETYNAGVASEQFLDRNGRTVLWRRFNRDDWGMANGGKRWSERLPENERLFINGHTYVHWYDCITDYIL